MLWVRTHPWWGRWKIELVMRCSKVSSSIRPLLLQLPMSSVPNIPSMMHCLYQPLHWNHCEWQVYQFWELQQLLIWGLGKTLPWYHQSLSCWGNRHWHMWHAISLRMVVALSSGSHWHLWEGSLACRPVGSDSKSNSCLMELIPAVSNP